MKRNSDRRFGELGPKEREQTAAVRQHPRMLVDDADDRRLQDLALQDVTHHDEDDVDAIVPSPMHDFGIIRRLALAQLDPVGVGKLPPRRVSRGEELEPALRGESAQQEKVADPEGPQVPKWNGPAFHFLQSSGEKVDPDDVVVAVEFGNGALPGVQ